VVITAGIDVGSVTTKAVLLLGSDYRGVIRPTGPDPRQAGTGALEELLSVAGLSLKDVDFIVGTGYGRASLPFINKAVTEITCHARGAHHLLKGTGTVIDIGGQDSKVIVTDPEGRVVDFAMNDKCAAGTGRFLQVMAGVLGAGLSELGEWGRAALPAPVNSMCAVFAESEVIGLLAKGVAKEEIAAGICRSVAQRVAAMAARVGARGPVLFTGGVAKNPGVRKFLSDELGEEVIVFPESQMAGAIGAALLARECVLKTGVREK